MVAEYPNWVVVYEVDRSGVLSRKRKFWIGEVGKSGVLYLDLVDSDGDGRYEVLVACAKLNQVMHIMDL
jgi:hypothetical protein